MVGDIFLTGYSFYTISLYIVSSIKFHNTTQTCIIIIITKNFN